MHIMTLRERLQTRPAAVTIHSRARVQAAPADGFDSAPDREPTQVTATRPTARTWRAFFRTIAHPAAVPAGNAVEAWYGLRRVRVSREFEKMAVTGIKVEMVAPRTSDSGVNKQWATAGGFDAYIVVGRNLTQMQPDAWTCAPSPLGFAGGRLVSPATDNIEGDIITATCFPSGAFTDTAPPQKLYAREFGLETWPIKVGDTLDVALVILKSRLTATITNLVDGWCDIEVKTADLYASRSLL